MAIPQLRLRSLFGPKQLPPINFGVDTDLSQDLPLGNTWDDSGPDMGIGNKPYQNLPFGQEGPQQDPFRQAFPKIDYSSAVNDPTEPKSEDLVQPQKPKNMFELMRENYHPETQANEQYNQLLRDFPQRQEPGVGRKFAASLAGLGNIRMGRPGGTEEAEKVMYAPYNRDLDEWKEKSQPYYNAANLERQSNATERQLVGQMAQYQTQTDRYEAQNKIQEEKNRISEIRALAYARKAGGWTFDFTTPTIWATSPEGELVNMGKTDEMPEADRIALQNKGRIEAYAALGANQANVANIREGMYLRDSEGNIFYLPNDKSMSPMPIGNAPPIPKGMVTQIPTSPGSAGGATNDREVENAKFRREANMYPSSAANWLVRPDTVNGDWSFGPPPQPIDAWYSPSTWGGGPEYDPAQVKEYNDMRERLGYPRWVQGTTPQQPPTRQQQPPAQSPAQQPPVQQQAPPTAQQSPQQVAPVNAPMPQNVYAPQPPPGTLPPDTGAPPAFMRDPIQSQIGQDIKGAFTPPPITGAPSIYTPKSSQEYFGGGQQPPPQQPQAPQGTLPQPTLQGSGSKLTVMDPKTGRQGTIDNTPQEIEIAKRAGLLIEYR